jgi:DNA-directed RNA polymerase subunit F
MEENTNEELNLNEGTDEEKVQKLHDTLDALGEMAKDDDADLDLIKGKLQELKDGTQVLSGEFEDEDDEEEEELTFKEKKALYRFVNKVKSVSDEEIEKLDDEEIDRLKRVSQVMFQHMSYFPKKKFGVEYKKKRQRKNRASKLSRRANRR